MIFISIIVTIFFSYTFINKLHNFIIKDYNINLISCFNNCIEDITKLKITFSIIFSYIFDSYPLTLNI